MLDLVIWMFVLALIPLAFGLAWSLISFALGHMRIRHARSHEAAKKQVHSPFLIPKA
jgi:thiosulfate reductase cytochrome b subunit